MKRITMIIFVAALAVACGKKKNDSSTQTGSAVVTNSAGSSAGSATATGSATAAGSAAAGSAAGAGSGSAVADVEVPTEMDFEDDATAKITDKNLEAQVQSFEKELGQ